MKIIKNLLKKIFIIFPPHLRAPVFLLFASIFKKKAVKKAQQEITEAFKNGIEKGDLVLSDNQIHIWKKAFLKALHYGVEQATKTAVEFCTCKIESIQIKHGNTIDVDAPIVICVVKNDLERIKLLIKHHRMIGVRHFVFLDNGSSDGTLEWLLTQEVDVYQTGSSFEDHKKEAWINKLMWHYGFGRWYIAVDSDEVLAYAGMENHPVTDLIKYAEMKRYTAVRSLMLDMYSDKGIFGEQKEEYDIINENRFFDTYYHERDALTHISVTGGPRNRLTKTEFSVLTKSPLVNFKKGDIYGTHASLPIYKNYTPCLTVLMHYRFLPWDLKKWENIVGEGKKYFEGREVFYKMLIEGFLRYNGETLICDQTAKFTTSKDLLKINILNKIDFTKRGNKCQEQKIHRNCQI